MRCIIYSEPFSRRTFLNIDDSIELGGASKQTPRRDTLCEICENARLGFRTYSPSVYLVLELPNSSHRRVYAQPTSAQTVWSRTNFTPPPQCPLHGLATAVDSRSAYMQATSELVPAMRVRLVLDIVKIRVAYSRGLLRVSCFYGDMASNS